MRRLQEEELVRQDEELTKRMVKRENRMRRLQEEELVRQFEEVT